MEFTCAECGLTAYYRLEGSMAAFREDLRIPLASASLCKARDDLQARAGSDVSDCPHLQEALLRAFEASGAQGSRPQGDTK
jgi:hypothetical protein